MADNTLSDETLRASLQAIDTFSSLRQASIKTGISRSTLRRHKELAAARGVTLQGPKPEFDELPPLSEDAAELIQTLAKRSRKRKAHWQAHKWRRVRVKTNEPFAITWFTDVHLGDNGCDYDTLVKHLEMTAQTPYAYSAFMGDASNNWPTNGRLAKKWADQETSREQERQLVDWFLHHSSQDWLFWVLGNHDVWEGGESILRRINAGFVPMHDWRAQFILECGNKREVKLDVSHNFKGHSQWNTLHAETKEAKMGEGAHFYFSGHKHEAALHFEEFAQRGTSSWLMRCRGYKECDEYAHRGQFPEQTGGNAGITIIDPNTANTNPIVHATLDLEQGLDYLTFLRRKAA
ncbi:hypothetical protein ATL17_1562 [Maritalea mobilis]|uniref:Calcineurin-like phosphoesterase family protein n=1 Tax=Maritalea mobilis TaxID=483324 RepID=A0A4R6VMY7_9HYPH|nr:hypothetical protein [Maritalea mobilis]TDQ63556.1 hypothetical protein ATL17_1562 [Maritalea mobilis]